MTNPIIIAEIEHFITTQMEDYLICGLDSTDISTLTDKILTLHKHLKEMGRVRGRMSQKYIVNNSHLPLDK
ncbi:MAG: hypothetical protein ABSF91_00135 [Bacteroidota bacterium]|jgi:hypothetical protein